MGKVLSLNLIKFFLKNTSFWYLPEYFFKFATKKHFIQVFSEIFLIFYLSAFFSEKFIYLLCYIKVFYCSRYTCNMKYFPLFKEIVKSLKGKLFVHFTLEFTPYIK